MSPWRPRCMNDDEWAAWCDTNRLLVGRQRSSSPCVDCLSAFAREMSAAGSCNGEPGRSLAVPSDDPRIVARRARWRRYYYARLRPTRVVA